MKPSNTMDQIFKNIINIIEE